LVFDLSKLKGSKTEEAYEGKPAKVAKSLGIQYDYMSFDSGKEVYIRDPDQNE
jgi:hypothetical protein